MIYWVPFKSNFEYAVISESYGHASIFIYAKTLIAYYFQVLRQRQLYKVPALKAIIANGEGKQAKSNYNRINAIVGRTMDTNGGNRRGT